jgi:hypothetical protein
MGSSETPLQSSRNINTSSLGQITADDDASEHWVRVFGFPPGSAPAVIQRLGAVCGPIVRNSVGSSANSIHVCFGFNRAAALAALALDGSDTVVDGWSLGIRSADAPVEIRSTATVSRARRTISRLRSRKAASSLSPRRERRLYGHRPCLPLQRVAVYCALPAGEARLPLNPCRLLQLRPPLRTTSLLHRLLRLNAEPGPWLGS